MYYAKYKGKILGPFQAEQVFELKDSGFFNDETLVSRAKAGPWSNYAEMFPEAEKTERVPRLKLAPPLQEPQSQVIPEPPLCAPEKNEPQAVLKTPAHPLPVQDIVAETFAMLWNPVPHLRVLSGQFEYPNAAAILAVLPVPLFACLLVGIHIGCYLPRVAASMNMPQSSAPSFFFLRWLIVLFLPCLLVFFLLSKFRAKSGEAQKNGGANEFAVNMTGFFTFFWCFSALITWGWLIFCYAVLFAAAGYSFAASICCLIGIGLAVYVICCSAHAMNEHLKINCAVSDIHSYLYSAVFVSCSLGLFAFCNLTQKKYTFFFIYYLTIAHFKCKL